jgi:hypothetical protein
MSILDRDSLATFLLLNFELLLVLNHDGVTWKHKEGRFGEEEGL